MEDEVGGRRGDDDGGCDDGSMDVDDLKRAVEDVMLRPDENPLEQVNQRSSIAALDLCQASGSRFAFHQMNPGQQPSQRPSRSEHESSSSATNNNGDPLNSSIDEEAHRSQSSSNQPSSSRRTNQVPPLYSQSRKRRSNSASPFLNRHVGISPLMGPVPMAPRSTPFLSNPRPPLPDPMTLSPQERIEFLLGIHMVPIPTRNDPVHHNHITNGHCPERAAPTNGYQPPVFDLSADNPDHNEERMEFD